MADIYTKPISKYLAGTRIKNLLGRKLHRLLVLQFCGINAKGYATWLCVCDCRNVIVAASSRILNGYTRSCGCYRRDVQVTHGQSSRITGRRSREYIAYSSAKGRCDNPKNIGYATYGGRGIEFRFDSFEQFFAELGRKPSAKHSLDRIENDGHYEPGNVQWATRREQSGNRRNTAHYVVNNKTKTGPETEILTGIKRRTLYYRKYVSKWCNACTVDRHARSCAHKTIS